MKVLQDGPGAQHKRGCACVPCETTRDVAALERLFESLSSSERAEAAGVVLTRRIVELRESMVKA